MPRITFMNEQLTVEVAAGTTLLEAAEKSGINVFRGIWTGFHCKAPPFFSWGSCNRCKLWVTPLGSGAINERTGKEKAKLRLNGALPPSGNMRLACQVVVSGDCEVRTRAAGPERAQNENWQPDPRHFAWRDRWDKAKAGEGGGEEDAAEAEAE